MATLLAGAMGIALVIYTLTGGADFGAGILLLFTRQREDAVTIRHAIAPIWEANHVWLIFIIVVFFAAFPPAFALLVTALHVPLTVMLIAIVLRGASFVFQAYDPDDATRLWPRVFALSSVAAPLLLGISLGAVASGTITPDVDFVDAWCTPFAFAVGVFVAALFTLLAAVYLSHEAPGRFRTHALVAEVVAGVAAVVALSFARVGAPTLFATLSRAWAFQLALATIALSAFGALWRRQYEWARAFAIAQVAFVVGGFLAAQYPALIPPSRTIANSATEPQVLVAILTVLAIGMVFLGPAFIWLFVVFKRRPS